MKIAFRHSEYSSRTVEADKVVDIQRYPGGWLRMVSDIAIYCRENEIPVVESNVGYCIIEGEEETKDAIFRYLMDIVREYTKKQKRKMKKSRGKRSKGKKRKRDEYEIQH